MPLNAEGEAYSLWGTRPLASFVRRRGVPLLRKDRRRL